MEVATEEANTTKQYVNCTPVNTPQDEESPTKNIYECKQHPTQSFQHFEKYRLNECLCDVTIKVGASMFRAHRVVLAASSPYFHAMFTTGLREGSADIIELHEVGVCDHYPT